MQIMKVRNDSKSLNGTIQLDNVYWGGERPEVVKEDAVWLTKHLSWRPFRRMNMNDLEGFNLTEIARWATHHLQIGAWLLPTDWPVFRRSRRLADTITA